MSVFSEESLHLRRELAYACRILAANGQNDTVYGHVTYREAGAQTFWMKPAALGLEETRAAAWAEGIAAASQASVFVTPPLGDWTLALGAALFPPDQAETFIKPLLERLSRGRFGRGPGISSAHVSEP